MDLKNTKTWHLIILLSLVGIVPGFTAPLGWTTAPLELAYWTVVATGLWLPVAIKHAPDRPVVMLTLAGLVSGVWAGALQGGMLALAINNNAAYASYGPVAESSEQAIVFASALGIGLVWGLLWGWLGVGVNALRRRRHADLIAA